MAGQVDIDIVISWSFLHRGQGEQIAGRIEYHVTSSGGSRNFKTWRGGGGGGLSRGGIEFLAIGSWGLGNVLMPLNTCFCSKSRE